MKAHCGYSFEAPGQGASNIDRELLGWKKCLMPVSCFESLSGREFLGLLCVQLQSVPRCHFLYPWYCIAKDKRGYHMVFLAHLSSAQDELLWSLFVRRPSVRPSVRPCVRPSVRPSVNIFKRLLLWSRWANFAQISYGTSLGWGNERLLKWSRSVD